MRTCWNAHFNATQGYKRLCRARCQSEPEGRPCASCRWVGSLAHLTVQLGVGQFCFTMIISVFVGNTYIPQVVTAALWCATSNTRLGDGKSDCRMHGAAVRVPIIILMVFPEASSRVRGAHVGVRQAWVVLGNARGTCMIRGHVLVDNCSFRSRRPSTAGVSRSHGSRCDEVTCTCGTSNHACTACMCRM